jgi:2,3-bisphosphoglycerate-independent phosphoglycerate mutase
MLERLAPIPEFQPRSGPVVLCIMDGVGLGLGEPDDGVATARTPNLDRMRAVLPNMSLTAHGTAVGLPTDGDMGNSEVGHNAMGAGRVFDQGAKRVNHALTSGEAYQTEVWERLVSARTLHLLGLVSDGNVHSHIDHVNAIIARAADDGLQHLRVHVLTDGRDVDQRSALTWVEPLEASLAEHRAAGRDFRIASGGGRMHITMDRYEADWGMVERGWRTHVQGEGRRFPSASAAIRTLYEEDPETDDQYLPAFVVTGEDGEPNGPIQSGDAVLFFNFRGDRAIEISRAFEDEDFPHFARPDRPEVFYAGMMEYDGDTHIPSQYLVSPPTIDRTVGEYLAAAGLRTYACSETQKFGHVTYFFNGNRSGRIDDALETYLEVKSDTRPFQERPWMKAAEITDAVIEAIRTGSYHHVRLNYANGDMVGHTGNLDAVRIAVEAVDLQIGRLERAVREAEGILLVTADHGNADEMWMRKGGTIKCDTQGAPLPRTSHSLNPVPFILYDPRGVMTLRNPEQPGIANIGPTLLELCGLQPPTEYLPGLVEVR